MLSHYVEKEAEAADYSAVSSVVANECARQKGHSYITTFCDLDQWRVVSVADASAVLADRVSGGRGKRPQALVLLGDAQPSGTGDRGGEDDQASLEGALEFVTSRTTTGIVEGLNSKIKTAMKRAYGFKSFESLRTVIYLVAGKIDITLPTQC